MEKSISFSSALHPILRNKQIVFDSFLRSPCSVSFLLQTKPNAHWFTLDFEKIDQFILGM